VLNKAEPGREPRKASEVEQEEARSSVLSLSVIGTATRLGLICVVLANAVLVARTLGPSGLGRFFLFMQLVALLAVLADGGLSNSAASAFGGDEARLRYLHSLVLRILPLSATGVALLAGMVLALLHDIVLPNLPVGLIWIALATLPFALYCNVCFNMLAGLGRIKDASIAQLVGGALWLLLTGVFVAWLRGGVVVAAAVYGLSLVVQAGLMAAMAVRIIGTPTTTSPAPGTAREFTSFAFRAFPGAVAYLLVLRTPAFMLNAFVGPASVGVFSAAQQLAERTLLPAVAVQCAAYRTMSVRVGQAATSAINRYVRFCWWGMAVVVVIGTALAEPLVRLVLGARFDAAAPLLRVLLPGVMFSACALVLDAYFLNQLRRPGLLSMFCVVQALLVVVLGLLLIPRFEAMGAAASLTLAQILGAIGYAVWHLRSSSSIARDLVLLGDGDRQAFRRQTVLLVSRRREV